VALGGYSGAGTGLLGPSTLYENLPWENYRSVSTWLEGFADAMGGHLDVFNAAFISASARANFLDPTFETDYSATSTTATPIEAPTLAKVRDTMLDVLLYIAGIPWPVDSNLTTAQKQALVQVGWTALKRKGTRRQIVNLASKITGNVALGFSAPPYQFSLILPDGAPSPGHGGWNSDTVDSAPYRPWILPAARNITSRIVPGWCEYGIGYSQFRAGFSAAGEPVMPSGSRLNALSNEHFTTWTMGAPDSWTASGTGGSLTQRGYSVTTTSQAHYINNEFGTAGTGYAAEWDLGGVADGLSRSLSQTATVNNQVDHVLEVDYSYTSTEYAPLADGSLPTPPVSTLKLQITESNAGSTYYWTGSAWTTTATTLYLDATYGNGETPVRARYTTTITPQAAAAASVRVGTQSITVTLSATSDGTGTTQNVYYLYRVAVYEKFDTDIDEDAQGERTLWLPLVDALGWTTFSRAASATILEMANAARSAYKTYGGASATLFPHHGATSARGYLSSSTWNNLLLGSNDFVTDWTATNCTRTPASDISPIVGETVATAMRLTASAGGARLSQANVVANPDNNSFVSGIWCKKISADAAFVPAGTITKTAGSTTLSGSGTSFTSDWVGFRIRCSGGTWHEIASVTNGTTATLSVAPTANESGAIQLSSVLISLISDSTKRQAFEFDQSEGWKLLAVPTKTFGGSDTTALSWRIAWAPHSTSAAIAVSHSYCYDVTSYTDVLYPPVCVTPVSLTDAVGATTLKATTDTVDTNVSHPLLKSRMLTMQRGFLSLYVVPVFGAGSVPDEQTIFHFGQQSAAINRFRLYVDNTAGVNSLVAHMTDNAGATSSVSLTMSSSTVAPGSTSMTWLRDTEILIRVRWDELGNISLSAGNGSRQSTTPGSWTVSDAQVKRIRIGEDISSGNPFDGMIYGIEALQIGAPIA
jgi:hypothetical protein